MIGPMAAFIAEGPGNHAGMVFIPLDHADRAVQPSRCEARVVAERIVESVGLDVGLVDHIQARFVTEFQPAGIRRVVGAADGIEVKFLHQRDVSPHRLLRHCASINGVKAVAVDSAKKNAATVDQQCSIAHLDSAESGFDRRVRNAVAMAHGHKSGIKRGAFMIPRIDLRDVLIEAGDATEMLIGLPCPFGLCLQWGFENRLSGRIEKLKFHPGRVRNFGRLGHGDLGAKTPRAIRVEMGAHKHIRCMNRRHGQKCNAAGQAGEPPHVLILDETGIAPLGDEGADFDGFPWDCEGRDVEFRRQA